MGLDQTIAHFRRAQEALFAGAAKVERAAQSPGEFDPETGLVEPPELETVYEGPAQFRPGEGPSDVTVGDREISLVGARAKFPHDTPIRADDIVTWTASRHDSELVGRVFTVTEVLHDDWQIVRVVLLEEVTRGPEEGS